MKKHIVFLLLFFFLSAAFSIRKSHFDLTFGENIGLSVDATSETDVPNPVDKLRSLSLNITYDSDIGLLLPWVKQSVNIEYVDGETDYRKLVGIKISDVFFKKNNLPFSGKLMYQDESLKREIIFPIEKQIRKISLDLVNVSDLNLYSTDDKNIFGFWIRPKFHHDGHLLVDGQQAGFIFDHGNQAVYYLKIIMAIICYSLFWGELIIILLVKLARPLSTKVNVSLRSLGWFDQKIFFFSVMSSRWSDYISGWQRNS